MNWKIYTPQRTLRQDRYDGQFGLYRDCYDKPKASWRSILLVTLLLVLGFLISWEHFK